MQVNYGTLEAKLLEEQGTYGLGMILANGSRSKQEDLDF